MRQHPISPVTEPMQYRAIGVVRGVYEPADPEQLTRGVIRTADGSELDAVVLGRLLTLLRRHLDLGQPHLWVVYPRCREEQALHVQMVGVWEPSTLAADAAGEGGDSPGGHPSDSLPEGDDYFSVRGELIFTRPESGELVIKVRQLPRADGSKPTPFKLQIKGQVPLEHLRHFVSLDLRRQGQELHLERFEVIAPLAQRGNRGGKGGRKPGGKPGRPGGGRQPQGGPQQGSQSQSSHRNPSSPTGSSATSRPAR